MDRLAMLTSFVSVCERGGFSAAAAALGRTQPAVSQQVRALEDRLGVRLLDRTTRAVTPTEAGARYLEHARAVLDRLEEADRSVGRADAAMTGRLAVGAPVGFGTSVLAAHLLAFKRAHPDLLLDVSLSDRFVDVVAERLDVAIRMGALSDERLVVRRIGTLERGLAATPAYLDRAGRPRHPADLAGHAYILHAEVRDGETVQLTHRSGETARVAVRPVLRSDSSALTGEAIAAGLGIGLIHGIHLAPRVAAGELEPVLPDWRFAPHAVHAVYPSNRHIPAKVRVFVDGLAAHLRTLGATAEPG
ncbi:LysR family transcriptional regulator [Azospirillum halopraeferens]|uniref:LysR family transcriptional regulator n=1 Tax=Azospirillum halopraeferens TaxID=34010 RepID=UPI0003FA4BE6|nr:LysR family transcriptional regulator [Azospirillum halopraeferens]